MERDTTIMERWKRLKYWQKGGLIGIVVGLFKIPLFILFGEFTPNFFDYLFFKIPDELICSVLNLSLGERCGFFVLIYGFVYNPLFYGIIGCLVGLIFGRLKKK